MLFSEKKKNLSSVVLAASEKLMEEQELMWIEHLSSGEFKDGEGGESWYVGVNH